MAVARRGPAATPRAAAPSRGSGENRCYASSADTGFTNTLAAALTLRFAGIDCPGYANHNGSSAHNRRGAQRRLRAPQPLLEALERTVATQITMAVARTTAGGPSGDSARRSPF